MLCCCLCCRLQPFITGQPNKKIALEQISNSNPVPVPVGNPAAGGRAVLVESGPVVYDDAAAAAAAAEEEEEDEEEACVSAFDLLGSNEYGSDGDYDD
ncbi:transcription factor IIIB 90 kDa subunit-like [Notothenia coriiceps]|uniref:Transcription factor IIIB 90 kDa subunit-like n=1 Tax=Notothenia coriiceps TaxID=8208 RepID=A0A6I9PXP4_9TELE|nr:PREDICTED: transcription factor IIIB 90 kDa subunit-like [Notothenia coriiceps]